MDVPSFTALLRGVKDLIVSIKSKFSLYFSWFLVDSLGVQFSQIKKISFDYVISVIFYILDEYAHEKNI